LEALSEKNSGSRPSSSPGRTSCRARLYGPLRGSMRLPSVFRRSPDCGPDCWSVPAGRPATWLREIGLYDEFEAVFGSPHGEAALRRMLHATFKLWDRGWPLVAFTLRTRRIDKDLGAQLAEVDTMRRTHLWVICRRLDAEGRLRTPGAGAPAADLAFALSTPTVFEELVHVRGWPADQAADTIAGIVVAAIVDPATPSVTDPPADWGRLPGPVQRHRPPIRISAHGPRMLRIAAERGDGWDSWGRGRTRHPRAVVDSERSSRSVSSTNSRKRSTRSLAGHSSTPKAAGPADGSPTPRATSTPPFDRWSIETVGRAASTGCRK